MHKVYTSYCLIRDHVVCYPIKLNRLQIWIDRTKETPGSGPGQLTFTSALRKTTTKNNPNRIKQNEGRADQGNYFAYRPNQDGRVDSPGIFERSLSAFSHFV